LESEQLLPGYWIRLGSSLERTLLVKFMQLSYQDLFPEQDFSHLAHTVEQYFSKETPLWWVDFVGEGQGELGVPTQWGLGAKGTRGQGDKGDKGDGEETARIDPLSPSSPSSRQHSPLTVACLWVGNAIDQVRGDRYAHIFLLYVKPEHRRRGIGTGLMRYVEKWARARGDRQIGLQVFQANTAAVNLYNQFGYQTQSLSMVKNLRT
jgi:ribosomal protein S18 acetylase RimI-like enzyme